MEEHTKYRIMNSFFKTFQEVTKSVEDDTFFEQYVSFSKNSNGYNCYLYVPCNYFLLANKTLVDDCADRFFDKEMSFSYTPAELDDVNAKLEAFNKTLDQKRKDYLTGCYHAQKHKDDKTTYFGRVFKVLSK